MTTKTTNIEKSWIPTDNRFVAFIDIMGFKDFVSRNSHEKVYEMMTNLSKYIEIINTAFNSDDEDDAKNKDKGIYTTSFSDSIILFSKDDSLVSLKILTVSASFLISEAMRKSIPMKGAIAHGQISVNKTKQIYFGQALIDAYLLQEDVNYYGIVSHNSIDRYLQAEHLKNEEIKNEFVEIKTPLKSGLIIHNNLNWFSSLLNTNEAPSNIAIHFNKIMTELKSQTSGGPRKYIDNTIDVFNMIYKS